MKTTIWAVVGGIILVVMAVLSSGRTSNDGSATQLRDLNNVIIEDGKQIVLLDARGGYTPRKSVAKAGLPTIVRFNTAGTFDCSAAVRIPSLDVSEILPPTGATDIDLGTPTSGVLKGSCGMGMYPFEIDFQ